MGDDEVELVVFHGYEPVNTIFQIIFDLFDQQFRVIKPPMFLNTLVYILLHGDKEMEAEIEKHLNETSGGKWQSFKDGEKTKEKESLESFMNDERKDILSLFQFDDNNKVTGFSCIIFKCKKEDVQFGKEPGQLFLANIKFVSNVMTFFDHYFNLPIKDEKSFKIVAESIYTDLKRILIDGNVFTSIQKEGPT